MMVLTASSPSCHAASISSLHDSPSVCRMVSSIVPVTAWADVPFAELAHGLRDGVGGTQVLDHHGQRRQQVLLLALHRRPCEERLHRSRYRSCRTTRSWH